MYKSGPLLNCPARNFLKNFRFRLAPHLYVENRSVFEGVFQKYFQEFFLQLSHSLKMSKKITLNVVVRERSQRPVYITGTLSVTLFLCRDRRTLRHTYGLTCIPTRKNSQ